MAAGIVAVGFFIAVSGGELGGGEGDPGEHLAGIFGAATGVFTAFLGGNGVFHHRDHQLGIPLQADDGELTQSDKQTAAVAGEDQFFIKQAGDAVGDLDGFLAGTVADFLDFGTEDHGVQYLHHGGGQVGEVTGHAVRLAQAGVAAVDMGVAFLTAEDGPFGEHSQAVEGGGATAADHGVGKDPIIEGHIDTVVVSVKGYGFDGGLLRLENFRRRFLRFRHYLRCYRPRLQS